MLHPRSVALVAAFDLLESLRSRKAVSLLALYATLAVGGCALFVTFLRRVSQTIHVELKDEFGEVSDGLIEVFVRSERFVDVVGAWVGDRALAAHLVEIHPLALFYGWFALTWVPLLVLLTSSTAITEDVTTGASRFALVRTDRLSWATGKLAGQALLLGIGLAAGALGALAVGLIGLPDLDRTELVAWLVRLSGRAWVAGFAFLGLYSGIAQLTRSVNWARGLCLLTLLGVSIAGAVLGSGWMQDLLPPAALLHQLLPHAHTGNLWHPDPAVRIPAALALLAFGGVTFLIGYSHFARRDA